MSQNKFLLWIPIYRDLAPDISINKKYTDIIETLKLKGYHFDVITYTTGGIYFNETLIYGNRIKSTILRKFFFKIWGYAEIRRSIKQEKYDFIWYRFRVFTFPFFRLIKDIKTPDTKIIFELGSFPFEGELFNFKDKLKYKIFVAFIQNRLKNYVYKIITFCGQDSIYNIPTIKLSNGINKKNILNNPVTPLFKNELNLISVSSVYYWHGLDRLIKGLANYYGNSFNPIKVSLHIAGEGMEINNLKNMVQELQLQEYVFFYGLVFGEKLNKMYSESHIGIGTLAMHRKDLTADSSLKNREYFAKGLPVILCTPDADFPGNECNYVKYVPRDDSDISIPGIIDFYVNLNEQDGGNVAQYVTEYATAHLTWEKKIDQIIKEVYD